MRSLIETHSDCTVSSTWPLMMMVVRGRKDVADRFEVVRVAWLRRGLRIVVHSLTAVQGQSPSSEPRPCHVHWAKIGRLENHQNHLIVVAIAFIHYHGEKDKVIFQSA